MQTLILCLYKNTFCTKFVDLKKLTERRIELIDQTSCDPVASLSDAMMKAEVAKYWQQTIDALQACQRTNHLQKTTFQWFHDNSLPGDAITSPPIRQEK